MSDRVYALVEQALKNAHEGGHGAYVDDLDDEQLAIDLQTCDADLEGEQPDEVLAAVKRFRAAQVAQQGSGA